MTAYVIFSKHSARAIVGLRVGGVQYSVDYSCKEERHYVYTVQPPMQDSVPLLLIEDPVLVKSILEIAKREVARARLTG